MSQTAAEIEQQTAHALANHALSEIGGGSAYTNEQRREAVSLYLIKGNQAAVERETGIPDSTLSVWRQTDWWEHVSGELRIEINDQIRSNYLEVVEAGQRQALAAMPRATALQAITASAVSFDKIRLLDNQPTSISSSAASGGVLAKLEELSDRLEQRDASVVSDVPAKQET